MYIKKLYVHVIDRNSDDHLIPDPVEVIAKVYNTITAHPLHIAGRVARKLDVPKTTVLKFLHPFLRMFLYRFQRVQIL